MLLVPRDSLPRGAVVWRRASCGGAVVSLIPRPHKGDLARAADPRAVVHVLNEAREELGYAPVEMERVAQALALRAPRKEHVPHSRSLPALPTIEYATWKN